MLLELKHIYKTYLQGKLDVPVLKNISLAVEEGEYVAIMGPSGSGKTTLMNIIGCLDYPTRGSYLLGDEDVSEYSESKLADVRLNSIGFVFQSFYLLSRQSALENVALPLLYAGVKKKERMEIAREALERVGLADRVDFKPTQLSGGQSQRVAIARAMVNNPKILLADEPTGALDTASGKQIMELFKSLNDEGVTVIMITHEPEIAAHAKRTIQIRDGRLIDENGNFIAPEYEADDAEQYVQQNAEQNSEHDLEQDIDENASAPDSLETETFANAAENLPAPIKVKKVRRPFRKKAAEPNTTSEPQNTKAEDLDAVEVGSKNETIANGESLPPDVASIKRLMEDKLAVKSDEVPDEVAKDIAKLDAEIIEENTNKASDNANSDIEENKALETDDYKADSKTETLEPENEIAMPEQQLDIDEDNSKTENMQDDKSDETFGNPILEPTGDEIIMLDDIIAQNTAETENADDTSIDILDEDEEQTPSKAENEEISDESSNHDVNDKKQSKEQNEEISEPTLEPSGDEIVMLDEDMNTNEQEESKNTDNIVDENESSENEENTSAKSDNNDNVDVSGEDSDIDADENIETDTAEINEPEIEIDDSDDDDDEFADMVAGMMANISAELLEDEDDNDDSTTENANLNLEETAVNSSTANDNDDTENIEDIFNIEDIDIDFTPSEDSGNEDFSALLGMSMFDDVDTNTDDNKENDIDIENSKKEDHIQTDKFVFDESESDKELEPQVKSDSLDSESTDEAMTETESTATTDEDVHGKFGKPKMIDISLGIDLKKKSESDTDSTNDKDSNKSDDKLLQDEQMNNENKIDTAGTDNLGNSGVFGKPVKIDIDLGKKSKDISSDSSPKSDDKGV